MVAKAGHALEHPHLHLRWLCNSEWTPLLEGNRDLDEVISFPRSRFRGPGTLGVFPWAWRLNRSAHKLSGSFALYGMRWAADHCRALELDAASGEVPRLADMIARLRAHLDAIKLSA